MRGKVAGVVDLAGRGLVGHRARRNEVLAADRIDRHAELARGCIDQPLEHIGRLRTAGAAIGIDRHGVGEDRTHAAVKSLDVVKAGQHAGAAMRDVRAEGRQIRAHVADQIDIHAEEFAVLGKRHPRHGGVVAPLRIAHEVIGAVGGPFHCLAQFSRGDGSERIFAVGKQFGAEAAADIGADHAHLFQRDLQHHAADDFADAMAALAADRQRQMIAPRIVFANHRARFHEIDDDARIDDRYFGDRVRLGKSGFGRLLVADRNVEQHVAGMLRPDLRRVLLDGVANADDGRELRPLDFDRLDRIARGIDGVGNDKGDGVADMAHFVLGEDRIGRTGERVDFKVEQARQIAEIADVVRREDQRNAGQRSRARSYRW